MTQTIDMMGRDPPSLVGRADFTLEMIRNLLVVAEATGEGRPITVEFRSFGIWALTPEGHRLFVGHVERTHPDTAEPPQPAT